jgi:hypothetical protein
MQPCKLILFKFLIFPPKSSAKFPALNRYEVLLNEDKFSNYPENADKLRTRREKEKR